MRKLRVALIIATLDRAGAEKQLALLARRLDPARFEVDVYALTRGGPHEAEIRAAGIPVTILNKAFKYDLRVVLRLERLLKERQTDIAYTWMFTANAFGRAAALRAGVPVIVAGEQDSGPKPGLHHWLDRRLGRRTDAIVANSAGVREYGLGHGWPAEKIRVIHAGIKLGEIEQQNISEEKEEATPSPYPLPSRERGEEEKKATKAQGQDAPATHGQDARATVQLPEVPAGHKLVVTACRLTRQKGLIYLMWAMGLLRHTRCPVHLWIVGDGPERSRLAFEVERMRVEGYVTLVGPRTDVPAILRRADLFILPSFHEGMSNAVLEAMLAGTPVVVSDVAGMRELVADGRCGRLVEPGYPKGIAAGIFQALKYEDETRRMAEEGKAWVRQEFSAERFVKRHEELFEELARKKGLV